MHATDAKPIAAANLHKALVALLALLALWAALALVQGLWHAVALRSQGLHVPAVMENSSAANGFEVEISQADARRLGPLARPVAATPRREEHVRVSVPARPYVWVGDLEEVTLAVHPDQPGRVELLSAQADICTALVQLAWCGVLAVAAWQLQWRVRWGQDQTWQAGVWLDSAHALQRPGLRADAQQALQESRDSRRGVMFWSVLVGAGALWAWPFAWINREQQWIEGSLAAGVLAALLGLVAVTAITTLTRRVRHDDSGIVDAHWLGVRRVPWAAMAQCRRVNTQEQAQRRYDQRPIAQRKGMRPRTIIAWVVSDAAGQPLLELPADMQPAPALQALVQRIQQQGLPGQDAALAPRAAAPAPDRGPDALADDEDEYQSPQDQAAIAQMKAQWQRAEQRWQQGLRWGFLLVVAPFVLMAGWATWSAAQYAFWADRLNGTVVEHVGTRTTSLVVAYVAADGVQRRIQTNGTPGRASVPLGATVGLLVPREAPQRAKLDEFWEVWIWAVILSGLLVLVAVPFGWGFLRQPRVAAEDPAPGQQ